MAIRERKKSYVISMRVSDEELELLREVMRTHNIRCVSDLMRQVIGLSGEVAARELRGSRWHDG